MRGLTTTNRTNPRSWAAIGLAERNRNKFCILCLFSVGVFGLSASIPIRILCSSICICICIFNLLSPASLSAVFVVAYIVTMISSARVASRNGSRNVSRCLSLTVSRSSRRLPAAASVALRNAIFRQRFYTTERVLELRTGKKKADQPKTLYDPSRETENCGVGLIASLKSVPSRDIVEKADEMLVRMAHRGGCGCDPASGDGSGT
jgi:hypothetical protein